jgi:hypothetical protein
VTAPRLLQAFLDESQSDRARDPYCYVLAAGICSPGDINAARAGMERLRLRGQRKVHWRDESANRRRFIAQAVAVLPLQHLVVVRDGRAGETAERRRRHCLERVLYELDQLGVDTATFESRGPADDRRDRFMLDALRARKVVSPELRMAHIPGPKDPLLWVPDTVCGAVTHQRTGDPCT